MLNWISDRVIVNPQLRIYEARLPSDRAVTWEAEGRRLSQKETTNQNLSAANFTAGDFSIALFFFTSPFPFSLPSSWCLWIHLCRGEEKPPSSLSHPEGLNISSLCEGRSRRHLFFITVVSLAWVCLTRRPPSTVRHRDGRHVPAHQRIADSQFIIIVAAAHCNPSAMKMWNVLV